MELNKAKFMKDILIKRFNNNQRNCALEMNIHPTYIHKLINTNAKVGAKFLGEFKTYCTNNNLNFDDYIFLP